jgi:hypothetical protein
MRAAKHAGIHVQLSFYLSDIAENLNDTRVFDKTLQDQILLKSV